MRMYDDVFHIHGLGADRIYDSDSGSRLANSYHVNRARTAAAMVHIEYQAVESCLRRYAAQKNYKCVLDYQQKFMRTTEQLRETMACIDQLAVVGLCSDVVSVPRRIVPGLHAPGLRLQPRVVGGLGEVSCAWHVRETGAALARTCELALSAAQLRVLAEQMVRSGRREQLGAVTLVLRVRDQLERTPLGVDRVVVDLRAFAAP